MRLMLAVLLAPALAHGAVQVEVRAAAAHAPLIILPTSMTAGERKSEPLRVPQTAALTVPKTEIVTPKSAIIAPPAPKIVVAARPMTEEEAHPAKLPTQAELGGLAEALSPQGAQAEAGADPAESRRALDSAFDGTLAPEAKHWDAVAPEFARGPITPALPVVGAAARSLIARLLPNLYRRVPTDLAHDLGPNPSTGHLWSRETGHRIEIAPSRADSKGEVPSAFGDGRAPMVQQKIERLMQVAHEYFHVIFDSVVGRQENHPMHSAFAAMTEGFAVSGEQLLIERLLDEALPLGLGHRDAADLVAIARARRDWLDMTDTHYSEGILAWRKAYAEGGQKGLLAFLASLSAHRMASTPRSDPAYQLALGEPRLLSAYLGRKDDAAGRGGLLAFAKAAKGEALTEAESRAASEAVAAAGPEGRRRLFERTLLYDKRIQEPKAADAGAKWFEKSEEELASPEPAFAAARVSPEAAAELSRYLAATIKEKGGAARLFVRQGPHERMKAILIGAEALPWDAADRKAWDDGVTRWLLGTI